MRTIISLTVSLGITALVACSAPPIDDKLDGPKSPTSSGNKNQGSNNNTSGNNTNNGTNNTNNGGSTTNPAPAPGTPAPSTPAACTPGTDVNACFACCDTNHPQATLPWDDAFKTCACAAGSACQAACSATFCADQEPSAACEQCLSGQAMQTCADQANTACNGQPSCAAAVQCLDGCEGAPPAGTP